jgi:hypothetical protein
LQYTGWAKKTRYFEKPATQLAPGYDHAFFSSLRAKNLNPQATPSTKKDDEQDQDQRIASRLCLASEEDGEDKEGGGGVLRGSAKHRRRRNHAVRGEGGLRQSARIRKTAHGDDEREEGGAGAGTRRGSPHPNEFNAKAGEEARDFPRLCAQSPQEGRLSTVEGPEAANAQRGGEEEATREVPCPSGAIRRRRLSRGPFHR